MHDSLPFLFTESIRINFIKGDQGDDYNPNKKQFPLSTLRSVEINSILMMRRSIGVIQISLCFLD